MPRRTATLTPRWRSHTGPGYRAIVLSSLWTPPLVVPPTAELAALQAAAASASAAGDQADRRGLLAQLGDADLGGGARPVRRLRGGARPRAAGRPRRDRRQRAEPEPVLDAPVRGRRVERGRRLVPRAPCGVLRCAQGRVRGPERHRRVALRAGKRRSRGLAADAFADDLHPRPRRRLPRVGTHRAGDGHVLAPSLSGELEHPAGSRAPAEHLDRPRGLRQARRAPRRSIRRHRPAGSSLPLVYGEYGLQTTIPPSKSAGYSGAEQAPTRPIDEAAQGTAYAAAIRMAACQPTVRMLLFFHVSDEPQLERLQTGVYYADDTPKASLVRVARVARAAERGRIDC